MKIRFITTLLTALLTLSVLQAQKFEFTYKGQTLKYIVTAENEVRVEKLDKYLSGDVIIPSEVTLGKKKYKVTRIGFEAFRSCDNLQNVVIPNSVTSIGEWAFSGCSNLQSVVVPSSVTNIGPCVFYSCLRLSKIEVSSDNKHYSSKDGVLFNKAGDTLLAVPGGFTAYTVPNSVTSIEREPFYGCKNLQSVVIPNSVTRIGGFGYLENLQNVVIPNSVELIEGFTFVGCKKLQSIVIPNSVMLISGCAFLECENLNSITVEAQTPPIVREDVFTETSLQTIYVPAASVEKYKAAEGWKNYADKIKPFE